MHYLEDFMIRPGICNSDTLEQLIEQYIECRILHLGMIEHLQESLVIGLSGIYIKME